MKYIINFAIVVEIKLTLKKEDINGISLRANAQRFYTAEEVRRGGIG